MSWRASVASATPDEGRVNVMLEFKRGEETVTEMWQCAGLTPEAAETELKAFIAHRLAELEEEAPEVVEARAVATRLAAVDVSRVAPKMIESGVEAEPARK